jgi:hypothetical protein
LSDSFDLRRFVDAQEIVYRQVLEELSCGRKRTHWMWFVFPQIPGLGFSAMAQRFAIGSRSEAVAYLPTTARTPPNRMHAACLGGERKDDHRHSGIAGRHEISVVHDVVRRRFAAGDFRGSRCGLLSEREGSATLAILDGARPGAAE